MKKIRKMFIMGLLVVALLVPMAVPVFGNPTDLEIELYLENIELRARLADLLEEGRIREPRPHLVSPQVVLLEPGEIEDVPLIIRNIGNHTAHNFLSSVSVSADAPFFVEFVDNSNRITTIIPNQQRTMTLRITVDADAEPGAVGTITLTHRFSDEMGSPANTTDTINVRVLGEAEPTGTPTVRLTNFQNSASNLGPDQNFTVTADIQNTGTAPANDVRITIANMDAEVLILTSDLNAATFATLAPGESRSVSFTFRTVRDIPSSFTTVDFRVVYDGSAANRPVTPFPVTVIAIPDDYATDSPNILLRNLSVPTGRLNVAQTGQITFELINTGDAVAHNVRVTASAMNEANLVPTLTPIQTIQSLGIGETQSFTFGFMPTVNAGSHNHPIQLRVEYEIRGAGGEPTPFIQYVGLNVYNPEDDRDTDEPDHGRRQIPRIIVSAYTLYPQIPRAGQNFEMEITFLNTSSTRSVNNIRITLDAPPPATGGTGGATGGDSVFVPVGGSNTLFVPYLAPGEAVSQTITMFTVPDAAPRIYTLLVNLDYQDEDFFTHEDVERLSVPVAQDSRLETRPAELNINPFMDMFGFVDFEFQIMNTGRVNLRNLRIRVDGNFDTHQADDYLGNLQQGRTITFMGRIFASEPGLQEGAIVIYAEDDAGEFVEIVHPISIYVAGGFGDDMFIDDGFFEGGGDRFPGDFDMGDRFPGDFEGGRFPGDFDYGMTGEDDGDGIFSRIWGFMRRPIFWGPVAGVLVGAVVLIVVLVKRKNSKLDFED